MRESASTDPSIVFWMAAALVAVLGARVFAEYLRRVNYEGPLKARREWLIGAAALTLGIWATTIVGITAQNLVFSIGYHPVRIFGGLLFAWGLAIVVMYWVTLKPGLWGLLSAGVLAGVTALLLQLSVVWSIGAEPGIRWQPVPLLFALLVAIAGFSIAGWMVLSPKRGGSGDRRSRRLLAALILGAALLGDNELMLASAQLGGQAVSAYAHWIPDVAMALMVGAGTPVVLGLMLLDQYLQQQARASVRRHRHRSKPVNTNESMFMTESTFGALSELPPDAASGKP